MVKNICIALRRRKHNPHDFPLGKLVCFHFRMTLTAKAICFILDPLQQLVVTVQKFIDNIPVDCRNKIVVAVRYFGKSEQTE